MRVFIQTLIAAVLLSAPAQADDDAAIDVVIDDLYAVISGDIGETRDWEAFRALFLPGATMSVVSPGEDGTGAARIITPEDYIASNGPVLAEIGFSERETHRALYRYGDMATVLTAYEGYRADRDIVFLTGINTIVLMREQGSWKIASIAWRNGPPIPVEDGFINRAQ
jgi:hypothetical protein